MIKRNNDWIIIVLLVYWLLLAVCVSRAGVPTKIESMKPEGTYVSKDGKSNVFGNCIQYTFVGDSLYIDLYPDGCGIASFELLYDNDNNLQCKAIETLEDPESGSKIKIVNHVEMKCLKKDKSEYMIWWEYKSDGKTVREKDKIRKRRTRH